MIRTISIAAIAACLLAPMAAMAQTGASSSSSSSSDDAGAGILSHMPTQIVDCQTHDEGRETADAKLTQAAWELLKKHDVAKLQAMLPQLEAAASHAPDKPSLPEKCGDRLIIFSDNMMDLILAGAVAKKVGVSNVVQHAPLPYARLDFIIGWLYFEQDQRDKAIDRYDHGLRNDPRDPLLASEYANALSQTGRSKEALAFIDTFMAANPDLAAPQHALMLRRRGYALGDLGRFDDAIAAYQDSQKFDPNSDVAKKEIEWNQQQKAGH